MMKFTIEDNASLQQATNLTATELLEVVTELTDASAEMQALVGEVKEMDLVLENVRHAHNTLVDIGASAEALAVFNADGQLAALADVQAEMENVAALSGKALESVAQKIDAALEEQKEGLWARFKEWGKKVLAAIRRFFGTIWQWLKALFGHGKLLSWKEAQMVNDLAAFSSDLEKGMEQAFNSPSIMQAANAMAAEFDKIAQDLANDPEFIKQMNSIAESFGSLGATESFEVKGLTEDYVYSYAAMKQALAVTQHGGSIRNFYENVLEIQRGVEEQLNKSEEEAGKRLEELFQDEPKDIDEMLAYLGKSLDQLGTIQSDVDMSVPKADIVFTYKDNSGKTPAQLGWNLKTCREYMKAFQEYADGRGFNAESVLKVAEQRFETIAKKIDSSEIKGPNSSKLRAIMRVAFGVMLDGCKIMNLCVKAESRQARYITQVYSTILTELRKSVRGANKSA